MKKWKINVQMGRQNVGKETWEETIDGGGGVEADRMAWDNLMKITEEATN